MVLNLCNVNSGRAPRIKKKVGWKTSKQLQALGEKKKEKERKNLEEEEEEGKRKNENSCVYSFGTDMRISLGQIQFLFLKL